MISGSPRLGARGNKASIPADVAAPARRTILLVGIIRMSRDGSCSDGACGPRMAIFQKIEWVRQWRRTDVIVWVNVAKLNESWKRDRGYYVARGARTRIASPQRYRAVAKWVASGRRMWMPHVSLDGNGNVSFTDGRHRFAWMRDHGVKALPVTTERDQAEALRKRFGSKRRSCYLPG